MSRNENPADSMEERVTVFLIFFTITTSCFHFNPEFYCRHAAQEVLTGVLHLTIAFNRDSKRETVLMEATSRLTHLVNVQFKAIAKELKGEDPYQYMKAYSAGE